MAANPRRPDSPYYLEPADFYTVRRGRPYLILSSTITRIENDRLEQRRLPCEMTPLYSGVRRLFRRAGDGGLPIGGGYVETIGFRQRWRRSTRRSAAATWSRSGPAATGFTLSDMAGRERRPVARDGRLHRLQLPRPARLPPLADPPAGRFRAPRIRLRRRRPAGEPGPDAAPGAPGGEHHGLRQQRARLRRDAARTRRSGWPPRSSRCSGRCPTPDLLGQVDRRDVRPQRGFPERPFRGA